MTDPRVAALCQEFGITIVPKHTYPLPGQTRATETIARILRRHGEPHMRLVLTTMRETNNNHALLDEVGLWSASDMVRACQEIVDKQAGDWLTLWDVMDVGPLQATAQQLAGIVPIRYALDGMLYERINAKFGEKSNEPDLFSDRRAG